MKLFAVVLILCSSALALPRQETESKNSVLDEPLADPELRRTLLRVFAESLRAAAEAGVPGPRSASNVPVEEIIDLSPPANAPAELGFGGQQSEELLLLSGEADPPRRASDISFTTEPTVQQKRQQEQEQNDSSLELEQRGIDDGDDLVSINLNSELQFDSSNQQSRSNEPIDRQSTVNESNTPIQPTSSAEPTFPGPSPAPPSPTPPASGATTAVTIDETSATTKLTPADKKDVQRFVSAVSTSNSTDEKLGDGVELFRAPLIAAFALQQDGNTGRTRSLYALPLARGITEELLKSERQTLSVAGQVIGSQKSGIIAQPSFNRQPTVHSFGRTEFDIQRSVQPQHQQQHQQQQQQQQFSQFSQFDSNNNANNFFNEVEPRFQLQELERRQQQLQQQLLSLQRERSALLLQRNTRSDALQTSASNNNNNVFRTGIPIYLQPPFF